MLTINQGFSYCNVIIDKYNLKLWKSLFSQEGVVNHLGLHPTFSVPNLISLLITRSLAVFCDLSLNPPTWVPCGASL